MHNSVVTIMFDFLPLKKKKRKMKKKEYPSSLIQEKKREHYELASTEFN